MKQKGGWISAFIGAACLWPAALEAAPCAPSATALCLSAQRFAVEVQWKDFQGNTGQGQAVALTADTGYFWFFSASNVELIVKVLDARAINGKFWVFFGALSNVEYDLTVRDSVTGASKTYHNPPGQFASVGDTSAFPAGVAAAATHEKTDVEGTQAPPESLQAIQRFIGVPAPARADFAPCPETPFGFNLNGCRFHLEVSWRDSRGVTGDGQPVQLTNDTGYFWFFSPSNVELVVKVLDARAVNGEFWVFFGALSNVEYALTVTDTVTGTVRRYKNPSGLFASVGDTKAFRGGYSVASVRDPARTASADIDQNGGSLTARAADGTVFTLQIPRNAVTGPTTITMTPVSRIDRLPFSGGLIAGVELEPEGLHLLNTAMLTIQPAVTPPADRTLPYAYRRGGEDFILYPRAEGTALSLPVLHFSGYGAGRGSAADASSQAARQPAGPLEPYQQEIANWKFLELLNQITHDEFLDHLVEVLQRAFQEKVKPDLEAARESCDRAQIKAACIVAFEFSRLVQLWGFEADLRLQGISKEVLDLCVEILRSCQLKAFDRCVARNDPFEAALMLYISRQLQELGENDEYLTTFITDGVLESCLRFELDFESKLIEEVDAFGYGYVTRLVFRSRHVPLRIDLYGNLYARSTAWDGECTLLPELANAYFTVKPCTLTLSPGKGRTTVYAFWLDGLAEGDPSKTKIIMFYDPGDPVVQSVETCPVGGPSEPTGIDLTFAEQYFFLHRDENVENYYQASGYFAKNWDLLRVSTGPSQNGEFIAKKSYERTKVHNIYRKLTEETHMFLKHTPAAPMPDCPGENAR